MRIISGKYKAKKLKTLKTNDTRPTSDKVRGSIFSMLGEIDGTVLDLFGGTGSLSVEALSRGAETAMIIDGADDAVRLIRENTRFVEEELEIYRNDFRRALKAMAKRDKSFDRSEEHTSELQSRFDLVCRLLLEKKKEVQPAEHN